MKALPNINIYKITDSIYLGDKSCGTNINIIHQFKISHIINCTAVQTPNQFESIGIKYLSINWYENQNQKLFDPKYEIVEGIIYFIDNSLKNEGILIYSLKGKNRACIVIIIYFMKKYNWCLIYIKKMY